MRISAGRRSSARSSASSNSADEADALRIANGTAYSLAAGVWSRDIGRVQRFARKAKTGTVWINTYGHTDVRLPWGGVRDSGFGREHGTVALENFTEPKAVWMNLNVSGVTRVSFQGTLGRSEDRQVSAGSWLCPDDARKHPAKAAGLYRSFRCGQKRLDERTEAFNREMTMRHGYCHAVPFWSSTTRSGTANTVRSRMPR